MAKMKIGRSLNPHPYHSFQSSQSRVNHHGKTGLIVMEALSSRKVTRRRRLRNE